MVVDTSAIMAILFNEPERAAFRAAIENAPRRPLLSAMTLLEASIVAGGQRGEAMLAVLDALVDETMEVVPLDEATVRVARDAFMRYGKGRHSAGLNFGDCASYALAKARGRPLLMKGNDFPQTDIETILHDQAGESAAQRRL
ncbi:MAG: type II toxin-antitoxin system VapC family toxin [Rhodopila sp.]